MVVAVAPRDDRISAGILLLAHIYEVFPLRCPKCGGFSLSTT